ncbi:hypothetical protein SERLADRAFT_413254 [Serpula lacrymans var. lacrymans S7.9]|uniref:P-loop containing nucleoside triphosphate hydrolase protein n=1 Tax=Serpula lacrymans var. lacrymans (strain S7.9) TaxID=578457 RepID=F8NJG7_SERL9|nr:uncharacterized protein SERLADRAFT_413254 [Serpula lacrymans var. lacrymans S7.9]EGO30017.1 hypothetical protein SERLADRAFT_413254 [Serpula lacrymans var. lacrymans S7.9]
MDLEEFDKFAEELRSSDDVQSKSLSAEQALKHVDSQWYVDTSRRARWMDLLGDYAGSEPFVIDGESLLQLVLDDPLLAIARQNEPSFQILHAIHSLERILNDFTTRSAVFDIVFWEGSSQFVFASRTLARRLLFKHLHKLEFRVHTFESLSDPKWLEYCFMTKPMFVMMNDGGLLETKDIDSLAAERILCQRVFLLDLLASGIAVTLLRGAEFRDSRISSFVYESQRESLAKGPSVSDAHSASLKALDEAAFDARTSQTQLLCTPRSQEMITIEASLTKLAKVYLSSDSNANHELLFIFIAHCLLLKTLTPHERARRVEAISPKLVKMLTQSFLPRAFFAAEDVITSLNPDIDVDGRVFIALLCFLVRNDGKQLRDLVGSVISQSVEAIWADLKLRSPNFSTLASQISSLSTKLQVSSTSKPVKLLPFSNPVFDAELSVVHVAAEDEDESDDEDESTPSHFSLGTLFADTQHWHNHRKAILPKHLGGEDARPTDERQRQRKLRSDQRFMKNLQNQAGTLTGASGAALEQIKIPPVGSRVAQPVTKQKPSQAPKVKAGKAKPLSKAEEIRKQNTDKKTQKQGADSVQWWVGRLAELGKLSVSTQAQNVQTLYRNPRSREPALAAEIRLYQIHLLLSLWIDEQGRESATTRDKYTVAIMRIVKEAIEIGHATSEVVKCLTSVLISLGLSDYLEAVGSSADLKDEQRLSFKFIKLLKSKTKAPLHEFMHIQEHPITWQLRLFGEFMDRSMDSQEDKRVAFKPDAWQREVLDCVDQNVSLLVVAPTSAGKTFISYYAMEKVLRDSDNGILVYVAPTKALVAQIAAEVYARFSKDLNGRSCWAIHTRDYRVHDPQNCQILITVPEILATMILSPPLAKLWTPRIKRIILDEIHSIGQQEGGAVWEQILLLAPCPIIGLSATVGSPELFNKWLQSVQETRGFKHRFIHHPHRYSHLRKFFYALQYEPRDTFQGLDSYRSTERLRFLHPVTTLSFGTRSLPPDLSLEASDTLALYEALMSCRDVISSDLGSLEPGRYFPSNRLLQQIDVINYEADLKAVLSTLIATSDPRDKSSPLSRVIHSLEDSRLSSLSSDALNAKPDRLLYRRNLIRLVCDLHAQNDLPAILFSFDRTDCEIMAQDLLEALQQKEGRWRSTSAEHKRKMAEWENWLARAKDRERQAEKAKKVKKDPDAPDSMDTTERSWQSSFDPEDPEPQFSFAGQHTSYSKSDLNDDIRGMSRWNSAPEWALQCLRRGIAVHHAGMNKRYRTLVESLFRQGFLRVVIATGTLALGINAPAKTSVFCGDSPFLTALMYRQCAGRAGRRGFDLLGKVVFYGLPMDRVQRLILSKLPSLGGNFPLTSTLSLRLFNLLEGSDYAPTAVQAVQGLMRLPHISFGSDAGRHQLLHHLRFSIDYLRRAHLLDDSGKPLNLFGIAAHLYYTEPSNLALVSLLRNGVLHKICAQSSMINAKKDFILLMCHLFGRRYLPKTYTTDENVALLIKKSPSMVLLPPLHKKARQVLNEHDQETLRVFVGYALTYGSQHHDKLGSDSQLPLSGPVVADNSGDDDTPFRTYLRDTSIPVTARSLFVANSGHGDEFQTVQELARTARQGLHLNEHAIPSFSHITAISGPSDSHFGLNAYLLDFYIHGQTAALSKANGIRRGDIWYLLQDFFLVLMTVRGVLEQLLERASKEAAVEDPDVDLDSGYGSFDPADTLDASEGATLSDFKRPKGVTDKDWRVYEVVNEALKEFDEKYRAMWA